MARLPGSLEVKEVNTQVLRVPRGQKAPKVPSLPFWVICATSESQILTTAYLYSLTLKLISSPSPTYHIISPLAVCLSLHCLEETRVISHPGACSMLFL